MPTDVQSTGNAYGARKLIRSEPEGTGVRHYYSDGTSVFVDKRPTSSTPPRDSGVANNPTSPPTVTPSYTPPSTPASTPPPVDPGYQQTLAGLGQTRDNTITSDAGQRKAALSDYGYDATYDGSGAITGLTFDPSNPFSRAALLQKSYQQAQAGNKNSLAARGQLYSGALQNAQNAAGFNYQQGTSSLQSQLGSLLSGLQSKDTQAKADYDTAAGGALGTSIANAPSNPLYTPSPSTASAAPAASSSLTPRKVAKTVDGVQYYRTASGILARIPAGAPIIK